MELIDPADDVTREKAKVDMAVDVFVAYMKKELYRKAEEGYRGHDDDGCYDLMWSRLVKHIRNAQEGNDRSFIHIACLAMFLYFLKTK